MFQKWNYSIKHHIFSLMVTRIHHFCWLLINLTAQKFGGINKISIMPMLSSSSFQRLDSSVVCIAIVDPFSLWSEDECQNFESGLRVYGKNFFAIHHNKVSWFTRCFEHCHFCITCM